MKFIEKIKNSLLQKDKISKEEFISSIRYLYSVNKIKISEFENKIPTLLKILDLLEKKGQCWNNIIIDKEKTNCIYNESTKTFLVEVLAKQRGKDMIVHIILENKESTYSNLSCEEIKNIFNCAFLGNVDKTFIDLIKSKIKEKEVG